MRRDVKYCVGVVAALGVLTFLLHSGCGKQKKQAFADPPGKPVAIGRPVVFGETPGVVAVVAESVEVTAIVHYANAPAPKSERILLTPGVWLVPPSIYTVTADPRGGVVCDDNICEVVK